MYGTPVEALEPLTTITLDLPEGVSAVTDPAAGSYALYLRGPQAAGVAAADLPLIAPASVQYTVGSPVVTHTFADPIPPGSYHVVVHESRIKNLAGASMTLLNQGGKPWTGWTMTVLSNPRGLTPPGQAEPLILDSALNPPLVQIAAAAATVKLDGKIIPSGTPGLSGEVLEVLTTQPANVEMEIEYLVRGQSTSLYALFQHTTTATAPGKYQTFFTSTGPVYEHKWAKYHGVSTNGQIPLDADKQLIFAEPVIYEPKDSTKMPLVSYALVNAETPQGHTNSYDRVTYTVTPGKATEPATYTSAALVFPDTIVDADNTPATNPRLYSGAVYLPDNTAPVATDAVGVYDLPLAARIRIKVDGCDVWWGQTRLIPLMVSPQRFYQLQGGQAYSPAELSDIELQIFRASLEALSFWQCVLPTTATGKSFVTPTMEDFVMTRLALGWKLEDGIQGNYMVRLGDHLFSGRSDHTLKRRLSALANLLSLCQVSAPLFAEDEMPADIARLSSAATPNIWPESLDRTLLDFWPTANLAYPRTIRLSELTDPRENARRILG